MRRILVFGRTGQVAAALAALPPHDDRHYEFLSRDQADLTLPTTLRAAIDRSRPDLVLNAAAYTAVDKAESEPGLAHDVNAEGPKSLARLCRAAGIPLIHLSTDYVFDGAGQEPYGPEHVKNPISVYGASKARGEAEIAAELKEHVIVRLAWVYSATGKNFLTTMLALAEKRDELSVVCDQTGSPTFAADIASGLDVIVSRLFAVDRPPVTLGNLSPHQSRNDQLAWLCDRDIPSGGASWASPAASEAHRNSRLSDGGAPALLFRARRQSHARPLRSEFTDMAGSAR